VVREASLTAFDRLFFFTGNTDARAEASLGINFSRRTR
jgi:hypothetical protein